MWRGPEGYGSTQERRAHPLKLIVWGMISVYGPGKLVPVQGTLRKDGYQEILQSHFVPQLNEWSTSGSMKLLRDGAPCHKTKIITEFLADWPGNSPDLNPIENIWSVMKKKAYKDIISNQDELWTCLSQIWSQDIGIKDAIINCIDSMPNRILQIIKMKAGHIKY